MLRSTIYFQFQSSYDHSCSDYTKKVSYERLMRHFFHLRDEELVSSRLRKKESEYLSFDYWSFISDSFIIHLLSSYPFALPRQRQFFGHICDKCLLFPLLPLHESLVLCQKDERECDRDHPFLFPLVQLLRL